MRCDAVSLAMELEWWNTVLTSKPHWPLHSDFLMWIMFLSLIQHALSIATYRKTLRKARIRHTTLNVSRFFSFHLKLHRDWPYFVCCELPASCWADQLFDGNNACSCWLLSERTCIVLMEIDNPSEVRQKRIQSPYWPSPFSLLANFSFSLMKSFSSLKLDREKIHRNQIDFFLDKRNDESAKENDVDLLNRRISHWWTFNKIFWHRFLILPAKLYFSEQSYRE